jgi:uncharacterized membrane protein
VNLTAANYISPAKTRNLDRIVWGAVAFIVALWLGLIVGAPVLKANGFAAAANYIYTPFSYFCHQIGERSFHLADEPFAVCARCFGVYAGLAAGILAFPLARSIHATAAPPRIVLLLAPVPTVVDAALGFFEIWANTHFSRFFTGAILGAVCAFFVVPGVVEINRFLWLKNKPAELLPPQPPPDVSAPSDYSRPDLRI